MGKRIQIYEQRAEPILQVTADVKAGEWKVYPVPSLPAGLPIHPGILTKTAYVTMAVSGSVDDGKDYVLLLPQRVDRVNGKYCLDGHPFLTYVEQATGTPAPTGLVWEHASYPNRTVYIEPDRCGADRDATVARLRGSMPEVRTGRFRDAPTVEAAMVETIRLLKSGLRPTGRTLRLRG